MLPPNRLVLLPCLLLLCSSCCCCWFPSPPNPTHPSLLMSCLHAFSAFSPSSPILPSWHIAVECSGHEWRDLHSPQRHQWKKQVSCLFHP
ncbi:hypothetical protein M758_1G214400 [Ceratodon purpureus]|nr:hypothetical protein M758_1G214400 [Ceratodon purpureus]